MIGNLPLVRFRQIVSAIQQRNLRTERIENSRTTWMVRTLAQFVAGGYFAGGESAMTTAYQVAFDEIDQALVGSRSSAKSAGSGRTPAENPPGSFERFMSMNAGLEQRGKLI